MENQTEEKAESQLEERGLSVGVIIYQHNNFGGAARMLGEGSYDGNALGIGNDQLTSIIIPAGMKVTLYEHGGFSGRTKTFTQNTPYVGDDFNDITSSVRVEKIYSMPVEKVLYTLMPAGVAANMRLSSSSDGSRVDLFPSDDNSGRQKWEFVWLPNGNVNIKIYAGTGDRKFLSHPRDDRSVQLWHIDDESGRQQWKLIPIDKNTFNIVTASTPNKYLSTDGRLVDLWHIDDKSGRQQWRLTSNPLTSPRPTYNRTIALKASNGQNVFAQGGEGGTVGASSPNLSIWEIFTLIDLGNGQVALQTFTGHFLCAEGGGGREVVANRSAIGAWGTFKLLDRGNGQVTLQAANGQYVFAQGGGGAGLYAKSVNLGTWEMFKLIDLSSSVVICRDRDYGIPTQVLPTGNHDLNALSIGNDQLSSLIVPAGMKVTLYEHSNYSGKSKTFSRNAAYVGDDFNEITSSIKVERLSVATYPVAKITPVAPLPVVPLIAVTKPNVAMVLPIVLPAVVKSVRDEGKRIADAVKPLSEGYKTLPVDTTLAKPLNQLMSDGGVLQVEAGKRIQNAIKGNKVTLSKELLGEFAEAGNMVSNLMNAFVSVDNPSIAFVKIKPGTSGEEGESFGVDPATSLSLARAQTTAVRISGNTRLFSTLSVQLKYAEFSQLKGKPYGVFKFVGNAPFGVGTFLTNVPLLSAMVITNPIIILSSSSDIKDTPLNTGLAKGFNFFGTLKVSESNDRAFRFIGSFLGISELQLHGVVDLAGSTPAYLVESAIPIDKYVINEDAFKVKFTEAALGLSVKGSPLEPALLLSNEVIVTLKKGTDITNLVFTGGLKLETESVTGSFTMQAQSAAAYTSLSGTVVAGGEWKNPFGIPGITIRELALQTGLTYAPPFIDNIGVHGNLKIGDVDGSMSILVDTNDPDQFVLAGATDHITIFQLMSAMSIPTFAAYQAIPDNVKRVLDKIVNLSLDNVKINIVPTATSIGAIDFEEGITVMGKLTAWGWHASMFIKIDYEEGLEVRGEMDNINLSNVLRITGAKKDPAPILSLKLSPKTAPNLLISSNIYLLGLSQELYIKADETGLTFTFDRAVSNILETNLSCSFGDGGNLVANGSINFKLNVTIPTPFGNIPLVDVGMNTSTTMKVGPKYGFYTSISGSFSLYGKTVTMPTLTLNIAPNDFTGLYNAVIKQIADNAEAIFRAVFGTLAEWANAVRDGVLQATAEVASVAVSVYNASQQEAVRAYQTLNKDVVTVANGLKNAYRATEKDIATALRGAGYAADQVSSGLRSAYGTSAEGVATALRGAGYTADQVASGLSTAYGTSAEGVAAALRGAGYAANEVGSGIKSAYNLSGQGVSAALQGAGYAAEQAASVAAATEGAIAGAANTVGNGAGSVIGKIGGLFGR